jgi:hypothetical protein
VVLVDGQLFAGYSMTHGNLTGWEQKSKVKSHRSERETISRRGFQFSANTGGV